MQVLELELDLQYSGSHGKALGHAQRAAEKRALILVPQKPSMTVLDFSVSWDSFCSKECKYQPTGLNRKAG